MDYRIIIVIVGIIVSLISLIKSAKTMNIIIVVVQIVSLVPILLHGNTTYQTIGFYLYGLSILLAFAYLLGKKDMLKQKKILLLLFSASYFFLFVFQVLHLPAYNIVKYAMIVPVGIFLYALFNKNQYKSEFSFMILFVVIACLEIL